MQAALGKWQPTPPASAGSGTWLCGLRPLNRPHPIPAGLCPRGLPESEPRFRDPMSTLFMTCSFSWMETLKATFRTPLAHPSIPQYPPFIRQGCPRPASVPGAMPRHEDEDTAARCPRGAGLQVGDTSSPLYHHETSVWARGAGLLLLCSPIREGDSPRITPWQY